MATTNLSWSATCLSSECNCSWVKIDGKSLPYTSGTASTKIYISAENAKYADDEKTCTIEFKNENGKTSMCEVKRCGIECGCDSYTIERNVTTIDYSGYSGNLFTVKSDFKCNLSDISITPSGIFTTANTTYNKSNGQVTTKIPQNNGGNLSGSIEFKYKGINCSNKTYQFTQGAGCFCTSIDYTNMTNLTWSSSDTTEKSMSVTYDCGSIVSFQATPTDSFSSSTSTTVANGVTTATIKVKPRSENSSYTSNKTGTIKIQFQPAGASPCSEVTKSLTQTSKECVNSDFKYSFNNANWECNQTSWVHMGTISATCCSNISAFTYSSGWVSTSSVTQTDGSIKVYAKTKDGWKMNWPDESPYTAHIYVRYKCGDNTQTEISANTISCTYCPPTCTCSNVHWPTTESFTWCDNDKSERSVTVTADCGTVSVSVGGDFSASTASTTGGVTVKVKPREENKGTSNKTATLTLTYTPEGGSACQGTKSLTLTQNKPLTIEVKEVNGETYTGQTLTCDGGTVTFEVK